MEVILYSSAPSTHSDLQALEQHSPLDPESMMLHLGSWTTSSMYFKIALIGGSPAFLIFLFLQHRKGSFLPIELFEPARANP